MMRVNAEELAKVMDRVRSGPTGGLQTNYFFPPLRATEFPLWATDRTLVFLQGEHDFQRLYFLSRNPDELSRIAGEIAERPLVADYVTQGRTDDVIDATFKRAGFSMIALYQ